MRHVFGFILALVLAAALFAGGGWGVDRVGSLQRDGSSLTGMSGLLALAALLGAGLLLGILLVAPGASPLAVGLPGLALLGWSVLLVVSSSRAERLIPLPGNATSAGFRTLLTSGVLALLGMAMVIPLFMPSRWRRRAEADDGFGPRSPTGLLQ